MLNPYKASRLYASAFISPKNLTVEMLTFFNGTIAMASSELSCVVSVSIDYLTLAKPQIFN